MILIGAWAVIVGYGLAYSGIAKLGGAANATLRQAFTRDGITPGNVKTSADLNPPGITQIAAQQQAQQQQTATIPQTVLI